MRLEERFRPVRRACRVGLLAVLAVCASSTPAADVTQAQIDAAIAKAVRHLIDLQGRDGAWNDRRPGLTALAAYALIHAGEAPESEAVQRALTHLALVEVDRTYDVACVILALAAADPDDHREWIEELAQKLLSWQRDGGWGYPSGGDLSNTQYAALGLRAAALAGVDVPARVWFELVEALDGYAVPDGGYSYQGGNRATGSMTCAGVGTVAICDAMLTRAGELTRRQAEGLARRRDAGLAWLGKHFSVESNPSGGGNWLYYYLYGLERVGGLTGARKMADHDWYREGAQFLVGDQRPDGSWGEPGWLDAADTSFGILFLRRATSVPVTGDPGRGVRRYATSTDSPVRFAAAGDTPLTLWITGFAREAVRDLEWPDEEGLGPRVLRVEYAMGELPIDIVQGDRTRPARSERYVARHAFRAPGTYRVKARVHVLAPRTKDASGRTLAGEPRVLESTELEVHIRDVQPEWMLANRRDPALNLVPDSKPRARASSTHSGGGVLPGGLFAAELAVDGKARTPWLAEPSDEKPTLTIDFGRPPRADVIVVSHARSTPHRAGFFARALEVEVEINGRERYTLRMHSDERKKARLVLERPQAIKTLELRLPFRAPGEVCPAVGIAEVELQRRVPGNK